MQTQSLVRRTVEEPTQIKLIKCVDGLHFSFGMIDHFYKDLHQDCINLPKEDSNVVKVISKCWGFVDSLHRIREIIQSLPTINPSKTPQIRIFLEKTKHFEDFRHYIQHLRGELCKSPPNQHPVWGSISWVDENDDMLVHTAVIGSNIPGTQHTSCVYDTVNECWVSKVCLGIENKSLNFDPLYNEIKTVQKFIMPKLFESFSGKIKTTSEVHIMSFKLSKELA